ncbi:MAG: nucleotidyltransferase family protein [Elainellaceae cyanobacterium]
MQPLISTKQELVRRLREHRQDLENYGVRQFGLFGSFQTETAHENSDIDVLVIFEPGKKTFRNFMDLCFFLEDLFGRSVDVVTPESLSPHFGSKILQEVEYVSLS